jgi:hypothetical protein
VLNWWMGPVLLDGTWPNPGHIRFDLYICIW